MNARVLIQRALVVSAAAAALATTGAANAQMALAQSKNCTACHAVDKKLIGPAFKDIAAKYKDADGAVAKLAGKVRAGGSGVWGQIPMPANPQVSDAEAEQLVKWVLSM
ncbi:MAG: c-type cytochrome [Burkholderiaceae bacterium]